MLEEEELLLITLDATLLTELEATEGDSLLEAAREDDELAELRAEDELLDKLLAVELSEDALLEELDPSSSFASPPQAASNAANRATLIFFMSISGFLPTSDAGAIYDLPMDKVLSEGTCSCFQLGCNYARFIR